MTLKPLVAALKGQDVLNCVDVHDCIWWATGGEVQWNTDNSIEDLFEGDGSTYSAEVKGSITLSDDGYAVASVDDGCGWNMDLIFLKSKEVLDE